MLSNWRAKRRLFIRASLLSVCMCKRRSFNVDVEVASWLARISNAQMLKLAWASFVHALCPWLLWSFLCDAHQTLLLVSCEAASCGRCSAASCGRCSSASCGRCSSHKHYTQWGIITGPPSFKRHNLVNIRFMYMKISGTICKGMPSLQI